MAASAQQDLLTSLGRQETLDLLQQIDWMNRCQLCRSRDTASNQDACIKAAKLGNTTHQSAFGLPTTNGCGIDIGQSQCIGQTIGIVLHQMIDMRYAEPSKPRGGHGVDRWSLIDGTVHGQIERRNRNLNAWQRRGSGRLLRASRSPRGSLLDPMARTNSSLGVYARGRDGATVV